MKKTFLLFILAICSVALFAQNGIGYGLIKPGEQVMMILAIVLLLMPTEIAMLQVVFLVVQPSELLH